MRLLFLDTETTGLSPEQGHRILEIAAIESVNHVLATEPDGVFHQVIDPECKIPPDSTKVHGFTNADVAGKPKFADIAAELADFVRGAEVVMHNAPFDCAFINAEFARLKMPPIEDVAGKVTDSLVIARGRFPNARNDLDSVLLRCGIDVRMRRPQHSAEIDARLLGEAYIFLTSGQSNLGLETQNSAGSSALEQTVVFEVHPLAKSPEAAAAHKKYLAAMHKRSGVAPLLLDHEE